MTTYNNDGTKKRARPRRQEIDLSVDADDEVNDDTPLVDLAKFAATPSTVLGKRSSSEALLAQLNNRRVHKAKSVLRALQDGVSSTADDTAAVSAAAVVTPTEDLDSSPASNDNHPVDDADARHKMKFAMSGTDLLTDGLYAISPTHSVDRHHQQQQHQQSHDYEQSLSPPQPQSNLCRNLFAKFSFAPPS